MVKIKEIMTPYVEYVSPETTIQEAAEKMKMIDVGTLLICNDDWRLAGVVTDRDITIRATAQGRDPASTKVQDVLTPHVVSCFEDQDVDEVAEIMKQKQIRRLVVVNQDKRLVGIVSLGDLALRHEDKQLIAETLECVSACTS